MTGQSEFTCRLCGQATLDEFVDLGRLPASHGFRKDTSVEEMRFPFVVHDCRNCGLLQIVDPIPAETLYADSPLYVTSVQRQPHFAELITTLLAYTDAQSVIEIASNDGAFLEDLANAGFAPTVGIEPNRTVSKMAQDRGLEIHTEFLSEELSRKLVEKHGQFDLAVARHVVEHLPDLDLFFRGLDILVAPDGYFLIELPYVEAGLDAGIPCAMWEEHVNYFSEPLIIDMLRNHGFEPVEKRYYGFGGGVVGFVARRSTSRPTTKTWRGASADSRSGFAAKIDAFGAQLRDTISACHAAGGQVAVYGAGNRTCTNLNVAGVGDDIDLVIDDRADLKSWLLPGSECAIRPLDDVPTPTIPTLILLSVGAEAERKVKRKVLDRFGDDAPITFATLVFPGDSRGELASAQAAFAALA